MKKIAILSFLLAILACKTVKEDLTINPDLPPPFNGPGISRGRVVAIAAKYGFQDSIAPGYKATRLIPPPEAAYPYLSEAFFEEYFAKWRKGLDHQVFLESRQKKLNSLQTVQEYFSYVENEPKEYQSEVTYYGGKTGYNAHKKDVLAGKQYIYICTHPEMGTYPTIVPADDDKPGTINGRLLRNEN
jgi:hypothetical protein